MARQRRCGKHGDKRTGGEPGGGSEHREAGGEDLLIFPSRDGGTEKFYERRAKVVTDSQFSAKALEVRKTQDKCDLVDTVERLLKDLEEEEK